MRSMNMITVPSWNDQTHRPKSIQRKLPIWMMNHHVWTKFSIAWICAVCSMWPLQIDFYVQLHASRVQTSIYEDSFPPSSGPTVNVERTKFSEWKTWLQYLRCFGSSLNTLCIRHGEYWNERCHFAISFSLTHQINHLTNQANRFISGDCDIKTVPSLQEGGLMKY